MRPIDGNNQKPHTLKMRENVENTLIWLSGTIVGMFLGLLIAYCIVRIFNIAVELM